MSPKTYQKIEETAAAMVGKTLYCSADKRFHRIEKATCKKGQIIIVTDLHEFNTEVAHHARLFASFTKNKPSVDLTPEPELTKAVVSVKAKPAEELPAFGEPWQDTAAQLEEIANSGAIDKETEERPDTVQEILLTVARRLAYDRSYLPVAETVLETIRVMVEYTEYQKSIQKAA